MKYLIIIAVIFTSCTAVRNINTVGFHSKENVIFYESDTVATLSAIEYSIDNKKYVKEMTFKLVNLNHADKVKNLLYFIHQRHEGWEIEIDYPISNFKLNSK
jgi:hypothetical protein